jgi:hypothetical protein
MHPHSQSWIAFIRRSHEFGQSFSNLMQRNDHCIPEEDLVDEINRSFATTDKARRPFTQEEAERYVSLLCAQDKIMKSDGCLYAI